MKQEILKMWKYELTDQEKQACMTEANGAMYIIDLLYEKHPEFKDEKITTDIEQLCIDLSDTLYVLETSIMWHNTLGSMPTENGIYLCITSSGYLAELDYNTTTQQFNGNYPIEVAYWAKSTQLAALKSSNYFEEVE